MKYIDRLPKGYNVISLGDNVDLKNTKYSDIQDAKALERWFTEAYIHLPGNHAVKPVFTQKEYFRVIEYKTSYGKIVRVLLSHGDVITNGFEHAQKARFKKIGASKWKRWGITFKNKLRKLKSKGKTKLSNKQKQSAWTYMQMFDCNELWMGHKHPGELTEIDYGLAKIVVFPQGITDYMGFKIMADLHLYGCWGDLIE